MQTMKKHAVHGISAFELTQKTLRNLNKFNLTPVAKLVLLELTTHLNETVNGSVVFPSMEYISNILGVGLTATKKAIKDLINEGLLIKSKRSKVNGNYNKYLLTPKVQNSTSEQSENELLKQSESDRFMRTNNHEQNKEQTTKEVVVLKTIQSNKTITLEDVPESIKRNDKIKDKCAYWASLSEEVKKSYLQKKTKTASNNKMLRKAQQVIQDLEFAKNNAVAPTQSFLEIGRILRQ
jgi:biotin operon repressor